jgi:hypothetical protein
VLLRLVGLAQPTLRQQKVYALRSVVMVEISVFMNAMMATICGVMGNLQFYIITCIDVMVNVILK